MGQTDLFYLKGLPQRQFSWGNQFKLKTWPIPRRNWCQEFNWIYGIFQGGDKPIWLAGGIW